MCSNKSTYFIINGTSMGYSRASFDRYVSSDLLSTCLSILQCKLVWWKDVLWFLQLSEKGPHGWGEDWNHAYRSCNHQEIWVACFWFLVRGAEDSESLWNLCLGMFDTLLCIYQSVDRGWCINNFQDDTGSQKDKVIVNWIKPNPNYSRAFWYLFHNERNQWLTCHLRILSS